MRATVRVVRRQMELQCAESVASQRAQHLRDQEQVRQATGGTEV